MDYMNAPIINQNAYAEARKALGNDFTRILGYFHEDGEKSIAACEQAIRDNDATNLVIPAHTIKGEAFQFGAEKMALLAEYIEHKARHCVEIHAPPTELIPHVARMREFFQEAVSLLNKAAAPAPAAAQPRRAVFGRKQPGSFGRASS